jgi:dihydrofolate reductase
MRKLILYSAISMDGYIAKTDGSVDWLHDPALNIEGEDFGYQAFFDSIDTTLMGANTFRQVLGFDIPFPYSGKTNYVFTRKKALSHENITVIKDEIESFTSELKKKKAKDIWLIGGGQINAVMERAGLIDEYILSFIPVFLGSGIKLFEGKVPFRKLKLEKTETYKNGMIQQWFTPNKDYNN